MEPSSTGAVTAIPVPRGTYRLPDVDDTVPAPAPGGKGYRVIKRAFDIVFSLVMTVVGIIPVAIICLVIRLESPGSPLFAQERVGLNGKIIHILKLRTMVKGAHEHPELYLNHEQLDQWEREQKVDGDPRITRVGSFLRRTSLDEVPQFLNVLKGDLSVIGPRPVTMHETYEYGGARNLILSVKPGITGWWQVTERNNATWESGQRQALEVFYARHASLAMDARIFVRTFKAMGKGN